MAVGIDLPGSGPVDGAREVTPCAALLAVTVFAYSPRVSENDASPWVTACLTRPSVGTVAVSRDLFRKPGYRCGDLVWLRLPEAPYRMLLDAARRAWWPSRGVGSIQLGGWTLVRVNDSMARRHRRSVDVWLPTAGQALHFGKRRGELWVTRSKCGG